VTVAVENQAESLLGATLDLRPSRRLFSRASVPLIPSLRRIRPDVTCILAPSALRDPHAPRSRAQARGRHSASSHMGHYRGRAEHASRRKRDPASRSEARKAGLALVLQDGRAAPFVATSETVFDAAGAQGVVFGYDNDLLLTCASPTSCSPVSADALRLTRHSQHGMVTQLLQGSITESWTYSTLGSCPLRWSRRAGRR